MHALLVASAAVAADLPFPTTGCSSLDGMGELRFTFNVQSQGEVKVRRAWRFTPSTRQVVRTVDGAELAFTFGAPVNEEQTQADAQFINDSFWLMPQCHMAWASDLNVIEQGDASIPVGEGTARKVTVRYSASGGGYTPGDAYDLFLGPDGRMVAWTYRRKAGSDPTLSTTFANYVPMGSMHVATEHVSADGEFRVFFTEVSAGAQ
ncbi:MAG: hypothetical protein KTR31_18295 [Myxococcales bacterium]|nr:hypothetical protein [Myxococcales bacterium]